MNARIRRRILAWTVVASVLVAITVSAWLHADDPIGRAFDLMVYRGAVQAMITGTAGGLYGFSIPDVAGPATFLYPPFAAVAMLPLALFPLGVVVIWWTLAQLAVAVALVWLMTDRSGWFSPASVSRILVVVAACILFLLSRPVLSGLSLGQASLIITALVVVDMLVLPPRWRGVLIGIAAAVKLTPLFFVVFFLASRQRRAAITAAASFAAATAVGFLIAPTESVQYWTSIVFNGGRVPSIASTRNLSLFGLLQVWGVPDAWLRPAWLLLGGSLAVVSVLVAVRHHHHGEQTGVLLVMGSASTLLSPVAWDHYLVWLPLAALYLTLSLHSTVRIGGWIGLALFNAFSPIWPSLDGQGQLISVVPVVALVAVTLFGFPSARMRVVPPPRSLSERLDVGEVRLPIA